MKNLIPSIFICLILAGTAESQTYIDALSAYNTSSLEELSHRGISMNLPLELKNKRTIFLAMPSFEQWQLHKPIAPVRQESYQGLALPFGIMQQTADQRWRFTALVLYKDHDLSRFGNKRQWGTVLLVSRQERPSFSYRLGIYYNKEYFGNFFMPLVGLDWRINDRAALFGTLPGSLNFEHRIGSKWYAGGMFRAITTSFMATPFHHYRIDDNRLGAYIDYAFAGPLTITVELGHTAGRRVRLTEKNRLVTADYGDRPYLRLQFAYRIRFTE